MHAQRDIPDTAKLWKRTCRTNGMVLMIRARQHYNNVKHGYGSHLAGHCNKCACTPMLEKTKCLGKGKTKEEREIIEAFYIRKVGDRSVSVPYLALSEKEMACFA